MLNSDNGFVFERCSTTGTEWHAHEGLGWNRRRLCDVSLTLHPAMLQHGISSRLRALCVRPYDDLKVIMQHAIIFPSAQVSELASLPEQEDWPTNCGPSIHAWTKSSSSSFQQEPYLYSSHPSCLLAKAISWEQALPSAWGQHLGWEWEQIRVCGSV